MNDRFVDTGFYVANFRSKLTLGTNVTEFINQLRLHPATQILAASSQLFESGWDLFCRRLDKRWSLVDCISFTVMHDSGLTDALTADHHFVQAGFNALLI